MIGQELILNKLKSFMINTLPKNIMLLGPSGAGKHLIAKELSNYYGMGLIELSGQDFDFERLTEIQQSVLDSFYLINLDTFNLKVQNKFLKFIEEPSLHVFIIIIASSENVVLPTILNRCLKYKLAEYTPEQLRQIKNFNNELIYKVCKTPGQLENIDEKQFSRLYDFCTNLIINANKLPIEQLFKASTYINCGEDYNKFDFDMFFNMLTYLAMKHFIDTNEKQSYQIYLFTAKYFQNLLYNNTLSKENILLNYFSRLNHELKAV